MSEVLLRAFAVVINRYRSPRDYTVTVERTGEMLTKNIGLFSDGFATEPHLLVGLFDNEADAWTLSQKLQCTRSTMHHLLHSANTKKTATPVAPRELDPL